MVTLTVLTVLVPRVPRRLPIFWSVKMYAFDCALRPCSQWILEFASNVKNGVHGNKWLCSHLPFAFSRTVWQRSKKKVNVDVTCEWTFITVSRFFGMNVWFLVTARQRSCGKEMFSVVSVHQLFYPQGEGGPHVTIAHGALDLTVQVPPNHTLDPQTSEPGSPGSDIWWSLLETCSNLFIWGHSPLPQEWHLAVAIEVHIVDGSERYGSYWNAFLFFKVFDGCLYLSLICSSH